METLLEFERLQAELSTVSARSPAQALALSRDRGHSPLGLGKSRIVFDAGNSSVVKIGWREQGIVDNEIESRIFASASNELQRLLCPVLGFDRGLLVQTRCLPIAPEAIDATHIIQRLARHGIGDAAVNLGITEHGEAVCFDYALISPALFQSLFPD